MDFTFLNYFRTAARLGNLSQAARELYISQPGLSRYLTRLERELGVPLFDRRRGRVELNTYGQVFLANVDRAFDCLDNGLDEIRQLYARDQNILSVACSIEDYLTDLLNEFSTLHPEIGIRQISCSEAEIEQQLIRQTLDLAICARPMKSHRLRFDLLSQCPYVLVCREDHFLAAHDSVFLREAASESFVCETPRLNRRLLEEFSTRCGFFPRVIHEVGSGNILCNLLETGTCVALIPYAHFRKIDQLMPRHRLRAIFLKDDLPMAEIGIVTLPEHSVSAAAEVFVDHLRSSAYKERQSMTDKLA